MKKRVKNFNSKCNAYENGLVFSKIKRLWLLNSYEDGNEREKKFHCQKWHQKEKWNPCVFKWQKPLKRMVKQQHHKKTEFRIMIQVTRRSNWCCMNVQCIAHFKFYGNHTVFSVSFIYHLLTDNHFEAIFREKDHWRFLWFQSTKKIWFMLMKSHSSVLQ